MARCFSVTGRRGAARVRVGRVGPEHEDAVRRGLRAMSAASLYARFGTFRAPERVDLSWLGSGDVALGARDVATGAPVALARCVRLAPGADRAEAALAVVDAYQGRGVGRLLAALLVAEARAEGLRALCLFTPRDNGAVRRIASGLGGRASARGADWLEIDLRAAGGQSPPSSGGSDFGPSG